MMNDIEIYGRKTFDDIKHIDENGNEFWEARELQEVLEYSEWRKFKGVIEKAKSACELSDFNVFEHFVETDKLSKRNNNASVLIEDYKLSRYACYLIVQNADSRKEVVALGQTYFAIQTRRQELSDIEYANMSEDEKRLYKRSTTKRKNYELNQTAKEAGVRDFGKFHNAGYKGLYNGETADDIFKRKGLRYREDILDNMSSDELIANEFRISLTNQKLRNENIKGEDNASDTHYLVGKKIRETIKDIGGIMPEDLPTPSRSLKEIEKKSDKLIK